MPHGKGTGGHGAVVGGSARRSIRARTLASIAAAVLAVFAPLILFAGLWVHSELDKSRRLVDGFLTNQTDGLAHRLDAELSRQIAMLQAASVLPSLDRPDLDHFREQAERILKAMPDWVGLELVDSRDGRRLARISSSPQGLEPGGVQDEEALRRLREKRRPLVRTVPNFHERPEAERLISVYHPVVAGDDLRFLVVAFLRADAIQRLLTAHAGGQERLVAAILDDSGQVLARSQDHGKGRLAATLQKLKGALQGNPVGLVSTTEVPDQELLTAAVRSPLTEWVALTATDPRPFSRISGRVAWTLIAAGAASLLLTGILVVYLLHNLVERTVDAERLAASQALGELDARLLATSQAALAEQRKAASEREVLLREIHHRVKNNLQIIQSLLRLGSRDLRPEQRDPFETAVRRIGVMSRVHTLLYASQDLASIDLKEYLEGLIAETALAFSAEARGIATELKAEPMRIPLDTAVPLAFIATELLTNAFQHAFPEDRPGGTVTVEAGRRNGTGILTVCDDGVGLAEPSDGSLGLVMVRKLVQQIGGTLQSAAPGTARFTLTFPLAPPSASAAPAPTAMRPSERQQALRS